MLPRAEDTDGIDTDKEIGRGMRKRKKNMLYMSDKEDHVLLSKEKRKAPLPAPPQSTYKKTCEIRNSNSVRSALQRLGNDRMKKKIELIQSMKDLKKKWLMTFRK